MSERVTVIQFETDIISALEPTKLKRELQHLGYHLEAVDGAHTLTRITDEGAELEPIPLLARVVIRGDLTEEQVAEVRSVIESQ